MAKELHRVDVGSEHTWCGRKLNDVVDGHAIGADCVDGEWVRWSTRRFNCYACGASRKAKPPRVPLRRMAEGAAAVVAAIVALLLVPAVAHAAPTTPASGGVLGELATLVVTFFAAATGGALSDGGARRGLRLRAASWMVALWPRAERLRVRALGVLEDEARARLAEIERDAEQKAPAAPPPPAPAPTPPTEPVDEPVPDTCPTGSMPAPPPAPPPTAAAPSAMERFYAERDAAQDPRTRTGAAEVLARIIPGLLEVRFVEWCSGQPTNTFEHVVDVEIHERGPAPLSIHVRRLTREERDAARAAGVPLMPFEQAQQLCGGMQLAYCCNALARAVGDSQAVRPVRGAV